MFLGYRSELFFDGRFVTRPANFGFVGLNGIRALVTRPANFGFSVLHRVGALVVRPADQFLIFRLLILVTFLSMHI